MWFDSYKLKISNPNELGYVIVLDENNNILARLLFDPFLRINKHDFKNDNFENSTLTVEGAVIKDGTVAKYEYYSCDNKLLFTSDQTNNKNVIGTSLMINDKFFIKFKELKSLIGVLHMRLELKSKNITFKKLMKH